MLRESQVLTRQGVRVYREYVVHSHLFPEDNDHGTC